MGFLYFLSLCIGVILGIKIKTDIDKKHIIMGVVHVDHKTGLCQFSITRNELSNLKCKKIMLMVNHNAKITEQDLENSQ